MPKNNDPSWSSSQVFRFFTVVLLLLGAILGGAALGAFFYEMYGPNEALKWAGVGLGISAAFATVKEAIPLLPSLARYVRTGDGDGLYRLAALATVSAAALALAASPKPPDQPDPPLPQGVAAASQFVVFMPSSQRATFVVPFFDEARVCTAMKTCTAGLELDDSTSAFIRTVLTRISACGTESRPVRLEVTGFASSSRFAGRTDSDSLNLQVAEQRALVVAREIQLAVESRNLVVLTQPWKDFEAMSTHAGFRDQDKAGIYKTDRGILNRRAEIRVADPAECEIIGTMPTPQAPADSSHDSKVADIEAHGPTTPAS